MTTRATSTKISIGATPAALAPPAVSEADHIDFYKETGGGLFVSINGGDWIAWAVGASLGAVDDVAALEALDASDLPTGTVVAMSSVLDEWTLQEAAPAPVDDITVIDATQSAGARFWVRLQQGNQRWIQQTTWFVDELAGDDENDGTTSATAIASFDELVRRHRGMGRGPAKVLTVVGDYGGDVTLDVPIDLTIIGTAVEVAQYVLTGVQPHSNAIGTRAMGSVAVGVDISAHLDQLAVMVDGPAANGVAWADSSPGSTGGVESMYTGPFRAGGVEVAPVIGNTVSFRRPTLLSGHWRVNSASYLLVLACDLSDVVEVGADVGGVQFSQCRLADVTIRGGSYLGAGTEMALFTCQIGALRLGLDRVQDRPGAAAAVLLEQCALIGTVRANGSRILTRSTIVHFGRGGSPHWDVVGGVIENTGNFAFQNYSAAETLIRLRGKATARNLGTLWGRSVAAGAPLFDVGVGTILTYAPADPPDFTPNTAIQIGGVADVLGSLPLTPAGTLAGILADA